VGFAYLAAADRRRPSRHVPDQRGTILEGLHLLASNVLSTPPDSNRMRTAPARIDLVVARAILPDQTSQKVIAIVLPGTTWQKEGGVKSWTLRRIF
jgi:predicted molibdopterin-dependent oxidoreductase YjgC